jgi:hypothetical protein
MQECIMHRVKNAGMQNACNPVAECIIYIMGRSCGWTAEWRNAEYMECRMATAHSRPHAGTTSHIV